MDNLLDPTNLSNNIKNWEWQSRKLKEQFGKLSLFIMLIEKDYSKRLVKQCIYNSPENHGSLTYRLPKDNF